MTKLNLLLLAVLVAAFALASGCSSAPVEIPAEVKVEIPVACIRPEDVPAKPVARAELDLMAMDRYRRTLAAWSDLKKLERYAAELEAIVEGCARITPQ